MLLWPSLALGHLLVAAGGGPRHGWCTVDPTAHMHVHYRTGVTLHLARCISVVYLAQSPEYFTEAKWRCGWGRKYKYRYEQHVFARERCLWHVAMR